MSSVCSTCHKEAESLFSCRCAGLMHCDNCREHHYCPADVKPLWAHQTRSLLLGQQADEQGHKAICITHPTGAGKRRLLIEECKNAREAGKKALVLTNRRLLTHQSTKDFAAHGVSHGVMAAGHSEDFPNWVQIASVQTLESRVNRNKIWQMPDANLVLVDECHNRGFDSFIEKFLAAGATVHGYTATPVNLPSCYKKLVIGSRNSELRQCKSLVPCDVFAPSEPDMKGVKMDKLGEYVQAGAAKRIMQCTVFADVLDWWRKLNPAGLPTLLWAPGVPESRWFVEQFGRAGVRAAHIDAETPEDERARIESGSESGDIQVVSSYGILREGADWPWISYGVLVQVCGRLSTFLQIAGRLLRAHPGKERATLLDFAGAYHRHGSPNADREWKLGDTDKKIAKAQRQKLKDSLEKEPICCPKCKGIRKAGPKCPHCFGAGTLILTSNGWLAIENVQIGDMVLTHRNRWRKVTSVHKKIGKAIKMSGLGHPGLTTTEDHVFWTKDGWISAASASNWATPAKIKRVKVPDGFPKMTPEFCRFLGCWLGDGSVSVTKRKTGSRKGFDRATVAMVCAKTGTEWARMTETIEQAGFKFKCHNAPTEFNFPIYDIKLARWLKANFGNNCYDKKIPLWVYGLPNKCRGEFLRGYIEADGHILKDPRHNGVWWKTITVSKELALGTKLLAQSVGHGCSLYRKKPYRGIIEGRTFDAKEAWVVTGTLWRPIKGKQITKDEDHFFGPVRKIEQVGEIDLYDLSVEEDHSFVAEGIVAHNCGFEHSRSVRMVRMLDGKLKKMIGNVVKHKTPISDDQKAWSGCLYACAKSGKTLRQVAHWFYRKTGHNLPADCTPQPAQNHLDWDRACGEVYSWLLKSRKPKNAVS